jgi:hypothetical protein
MTAVFSTAWTSPKIYINGVDYSVPVATATCGALAVTNTCYIGADPIALTTRGWNGKLDEVKVYKNVAFTTNDALADYIGTGGTAPHWMQSVNRRDENR